MSNIQVEVKGDKLIITVDVSAKSIKAAPMSKSGKNKLVASSGGMEKVDGRDGLRYGLNVIAKE